MSARSEATCSGAYRFLCLLVLLCVLALPEGAGAQSETGPGSGAPPRDADGVAAPGSQAPAAGEEREDLPRNAAAFKGWQISEFALDGMPKDLAERARRGLALSGNSRFLFKEYPDFFPRVLSQDLDRLQLFLARNGYPYARLDSELEDKGGDRFMALRIRVHPGRPVRVDSLRIDGLSDELESAGRDAISIATGDAFREAQVQESLTRLRNLLMDKGHALAEISATTSALDSFRVALSFHADPGPVFHYVQVGVTGVNPSLAKLARESAGIQQGDRYSPEELDRAREELQLLGLYRQIRLEPRLQAADSLALDLLLSVGAPRTIETSLGYWSDESIRARLRWEHRNLLGAGRGLRAELRYYTALLGGEVSTWWPNSFGPHTRSSLRALVEDQREENYDLISTELNYAATYRSSRRTTWQAGVSLSEVDVQVKAEAADAFIEQGGTLTYAQLGWNRSTIADQRVNIYCKKLKKPKAPPTI